MIYLSTKFTFLPPYVIRNLVMEWNAMNTLVEYFKTVVQLSSREYPTRSKWWDIEGGWRHDSLSYYVGHRTYVLLLWLLTGFVDGICWWDLLTGFVDRICQDINIKKLQCKNILINITIQISKQKWNLLIPQLNK